MQLQWGSVSYTVGVCHLYSGGLSLIGGGEIIRQQYGLVDGRERRM